MRRGRNELHIFAADRAMLATVPGLKPAHVNGYPTRHVRDGNDSLLVVMKAQGGKEWVVRYYVSNDGCQGTCVGQVNTTRENFAQTVATLEEVGEMMRPGVIGHKV
jgi:hypothetical protein